MRPLISRGLGLAVGIAIIGALAAFASCAQGSPDAADIRKGHQLALEICAVCHVVAPDQKMPPVLNEPGPSFRSIANRKDVTADFVRTFLRTTHATTTSPFKMPDPQLADYETNAIVTYLLSLKRHR